MSRHSYITTSWDDGHPLDLRVAALLTKYGIRGTFYVPAATERPTMTARELRELGGSFEIGAHSLSHLDLRRASPELACREIALSKTWIEDNTGQPCRMFCPPLGRYASRHLEMVRDAGYRGLRSVELCSIDRPRQKAGIMVMPTSVQAHPHNFGAFYRNALKRAAFGNLWRFIAHGEAPDWPKLARTLLHQAIAEGGVFHLWGHSWEIEETGQWQRLEEVLRMLGEAAHEAAARTNAEIVMLGEAAHDDSSMSDTEICAIRSSAP